MAHSTPVPETSPQKSWVLRSTHPDSPNLDRHFSEFAIGIQEGDLRGSEGEQHGRYLSPFSGRPGLIADLMTAIRDAYTARPNSSVSTLCSPAMTRRMVRWPEAAASAASSCVAYPSSGGDLAQARRTAGHRRAKLDGSG